MNLTKILQNFNIFCKKVLLNPVKRDEIAQIILLIFLSIVQTFLQENSLNFGLVMKLFARKRPPRSPVPYLHNLKLFLFQCILLQKIP